MPKNAELKSVLIMMVMKLDAKVMLQVAYITKLNVL